MTDKPTISDLRLPCDEHQSHDCRVGLTRRPGTTCPGGRVPTRQELIDMLGGKPLDWCAVHDTIMPSALCEVGWDEYAENNRDPEPMCEQVTIFIVPVDAALGGGTDVYPDEINAGPLNTTYLLEASDSPYGPTTSVLNLPSDGT